MSKKKTESKREGLYFMPIGGCSEIGVNLYVYAYNDQWILVDMGMGFDNELGKELLVPSPEFLIKNKSKIKALFITHSHEDHIGAIPYIWQMVQCPIYARTFAAEMIREKLIQFRLEKEVPLIKVSPNAKVTIDCFEIEFIPVAHSTPESTALAISTPEGIVIHTGDWRLDDDPVLGSKTDEEKIKSYKEKGVLALVCDSTNVFRDVRYISEKDVRKNMIDLVKKHKKNRIVVTCFASNLARLETCYLAAKESGRQLVISGRSLKRIEKIAKISGYFKEIPAFLDEKKANSLDPSKILLVCTGSQGELNSALNKIAHGTHKTIKIQDRDVVIFSSRVIPGNEKSVLEIQNALVEQNVKIITDIDCEIHASGHPSREELEHLYSISEPNILIPIHGEMIQLYKHAEIAREYGIKNVVIPKNGSLIKIEKDRPKIIDKIDVELLAVDGNRLIPTSGIVYKQRENLSCNGAVSACIKIEKGSIKLVGFSHFGIFENSETDEINDIKNDIASEIKLSLEDIIKNKHQDKEKIKSSVEKIIVNTFLETRGKKPVVMVHII